MPPNQQNGRCGFQTENIRQSVNSYQQKLSCSESYFKYQQWLETVEFAICSVALSWEGKSTTAQAHSFHMPY